MPGDHNKQTQHLTWTGVSCGRDDCQLLETTGHNPKGSVGLAGGGGGGGQRPTVCDGDGHWFNLQEGAEKEQEKNLMMLIGCEAIFPKVCQEKTASVFGPGGVSVRYELWGLQRLTAEAKRCEERLWMSRLKRHSSYRGKKELIWLKEEADSRWWQDK